MGWQITVVVLRLIHVVSGVIWVGATVLLARFLLPSIRTLGPAGSAFMQEIAQRRKLPVFMNVAGLLTILSGIALYWRMSSLTAGQWARTGTGMTFALGGLLAIIAAVIGGSVSRPIAQRLGELGAQIVAAGGPPSAEQRADLESLQGRLGRATNLLALLLLIAAALMGIARYV